MFKINAPPPKKKKNYFSLPTFSDQAKENFKT